MSRWIGCRITRARRLKGRTIAWKSDPKSGEMSFFYTDPQGKEDFRKMQGVMQILLRQGGDVDADKKQVIYLCYRVPTEYEDYTELKDLFPMVAGCLTLGE